MPEPGLRAKLQPSLLDRLRDDDPDQPADEGDAEDTGAACTPRQIKDAVRRDLEWLLNTKRPLNESIESLGPLATSVYTYGLPDPTNLSLDNMADRERLRQGIEEAIRAFDPRLDRVAVTLLPSPPLAQALHYEIQAQLNVAPKPIAIRFDSVLQLQSSTFQVRGETEQTAPEAPNRAAS